jgi:hypothetical protein
MTSIFRKLDHGLQRGDEVMVAGEWYPVTGYSGTVHPGGTSSLDIFTSKPIGKYEPWLGYRIDSANVTDCRRPTAEAL